MLRVQDFVAHAVCNVHVGQAAAVVDAVVRCSTADSGDAAKQAQAAAFAREARRALDHRRNARRC